MPETAQPYVRCPGLALFAGMMLDLLEPESPLQEEPAAQPETARPGILT